MGEEVRNEPIKLNQSEDTHMLENDRKKKSKLYIIIPIIVTVILLLSVGVYILLGYIDAKKPIAEDWGQTYYVYLKDKKQNASEDEKIPDNAKMRFIEVKDVEQPVMVINYEFKQNTYTNVYYIEDNKVNTIIYQEPSEVNLLYNITTQEYNYYFHVETDSKDQYKSIDEQIKANDESNEQVESDYSFGKDTIDKVVDENGNEIVVSEFDKVFVVPDVEVTEVDYNEDLSDKELKAVVEDSITHYQPKEDILTDEIKDKVNQKIEQTNANIEYIEKTSIETILKKLKGVWMVGSSGETIEFYSLYGKDAFGMGWMASESYIAGEIQNMKYKGNSLYEFTVKSISDDRQEQVIIDVSNIDNKTVTIGDTVYTYYAKDFDTAFEKYIGF